MPKKILLDDQISSVWYNVLVLRFVSYVIIVVQILLEFTDIKAILLLF